MIKAGDKRGGERGGGGGGRSRGRVKESGMQGDKAGTCGSVFSKLRGKRGWGSSISTLISLVQCNIIVTTKFLFWGKLRFKFWKSLSNHGVTTQFRLNNSHFKANCGITTHL